MTRVAADLAALVVALAFAGGCLHVPKYLGNDGGEGIVDAAADAADAPDAMQFLDAADQLGSAVVVTVDGSGCTLAAGEIMDGCTITVAAAGASTIFSPTGSHLPARLDIGGTDVLSHAGATPSEDGIGFEFVDGSMGSAVGVNAADSPTGTTATSYVVTYGDAFAEIEVRGTSLGSSGVPTCAGTIRWDSTFSFFPDGRIVRDDRVTPMDLTPCRLAATYASISTAAFDEVLYSSGSSSADIIDTSMNAALTLAPGSFAVCLDTTGTPNGAHVAIESAGGPSTVQQPELVIHAGSAVAALADWLYTGTGMDGSSSPPSSVASADVDYQVAAAGSCSDLDGRLVTLPSLSVAFTAVPALGLYTATYSPDLALTTSAGLPAGFTLRLSSVPPGLVITSNGNALTAGVNYLAEADANAPGEYTIWFAHSVNSTQTLRFTAPAP